MSALKLTQIGNSVGVILPKGVLARLELANPTSRLVPGMFVSMQFTDTQAPKALLVPTEAVIQTGRRTVVIVADGEGRSGHFRPVEVEIGTEGGGQTHGRLHRLFADVGTVGGDQNFLVHLVLL